ncbi:hypothetical protein ACFYVL_15095 [Streptomyces sp. NPDC004111]|uniref:hypothetical protein n=1 Tax=Streptomyces sp. NPDC004111 TaxID=3364690 RepID=UPI00368640FA
MSGGTVAALAVADFRDRRRRPAYLVVLLGALALGLLAAPIGSSTWQIFQISGYRGIYTSGYVGTVTALGGAVWLALAGFNITRGTVAKDEQNGVGQILAATPMSRISYLAGKFCSNLLLLGSMLLALAVTSLAVQLIKGESTQVDVVRLLLPFVVIALPLLAFVAGCAVLFDTVPGLRGGPGALVWFVVWLGGIMAAQASSGYDLLGMGRISESMVRAIEASGHPAGALRFGVGLTASDRPLTAFDWDGLGIGDLGGGLLANAVLLLVGALVVGLLAALWFRRFDPSGAQWPPAGRRADKGTAGTAERTDGAVAPSGGQVPPAVPEPSGSTAFSRTLAQTTAPRTGAALLPTFVGELRVLVQGLRWWWLGVPVITLTAALVPIENVHHPLLAVAMLWPVLLWSRLGHHAGAGSLVDLLAACPGGLRRLLAGLLAGITVALAMTVVPLVRLAVAGDTAAVTAALAGVLVVPALALLCGMASRGPRLFQSLYPLLWYAMFNRVSEVDFLGVVPDGGPPAGAVATVALLLALAAFAVAAVRGARR